MAKPLSVAYAALSTPFLRRPISLPSHIEAIGIGSAVLGGAGKTLVAIAYAQHLARAGGRVAFIAHGYRANQVEPLRCDGTQPVGQVGDDTLLAARILHPEGIPVWVGKDRGQVIRKAAQSRDMVVLDGVLQTRPNPLHRSVLVLDANHPFGSGVCLPAGDLKSPILDLVEVSDEIVVVKDGLSSAPFHPWLMNINRPVRSLAIDISSVMKDRTRMPLGWLRGKRMGLLTLLAHPDRVVASLSLRTVAPFRCWHGADHGSLGPRKQRELRNIAGKLGLEGWLVTTKCVTHLETLDLGAPLFVMEVTTRLDPTLRPVLDSQPCVPQDSSSSSRPRCWSSVL